MNVSFVEVLCNIKNVMDVLNKYKLLTRPKTLYYLNHNFQLLQWHSLKNANINNKDKSSVYIVTLTLIKMFKCSAKYAIMFFNRGLYSNREPWNAL